MDEQPYPGMLKVESDTVIYYGYRGNGKVNKKLPR